MIEIRLIFIKIILTMLFLYTPSFAINIEEINVSGNGHSRWIIGTASDKAPYHAAYVSDLVFTVPINSNFSVDYTLRYDNPSVSHGYNQKQKLLNWLKFTYFKPINSDNNFKIEAGNLKKLSFGKELLLKDFESEGFRLFYQFQDISSSLTYIGSTMALYGDYIIVDAFLNKKNIGAYYFSYIDSINPKNGNVPINANTINIYGSFINSPYFWINFETSYGLNSNGTPIAGLIAPQFQFENKKNKLSITLTGRFYSSSFNKAFSNQPLRKVYHSLEEESYDYDNWRNYLLYGAIKSQSKSSGISSRIKYERQLYKILWLFSDLEFINEFYDSKTNELLFYTYGLKALLTKNNSVYIAIQNKVLNSEDQEEFGSKERNAPVFEEIDSFLVLGARFKF